MAAGTLYSKLKAKAQTATATKLGEDVTYKPQALSDTPGTERAIRAIVKRDQPDEYGNSYTQINSVRVDNDSTTGITPEELDLGNDALSVALEPGGTPEDRVIKRIISQNHVRLVIEVT